MPKRKLKRGKPKSQMAHEYQKDLQDILNDFPFGPIPICQSKTHIVTTGQSVHYALYTGYTLNDINPSWNRFAI